MLKISKATWVKKLTLSAVFFSVSCFCYADVSVVVHPSSSIESLTTKQIKKLLF